MSWEGATLFAALPAGINAYLLAARHRAGEETASSVIVLSTLLSLISLSVWLAILMPLTLPCPRRKS